MRGSRLMIGGIPVRRIGLGTNRLTPQSSEILSHAIKAGINFIDTAYLYTNGASETAIGNTLAPYSEDIVIASKGGYGSGEGNNDPDYLTSNLKQSLSRLRTRRITLYQLHRVDSRVPLSKTMELLKTFRKEGLIQHIGLSEVTVDQIQEASKFVEIVSVQNEYSLGQRSHEAVVDYCTENDIVFIPYFPLHHIAGQLGAVLEEVAGNYQATSQQVALAWLLKRSPQMLPIPGTLSEEHLKQNVDAINIHLTDTDYRRLDSITLPRS